MRVRERVGAVASRTAAAGRADACCADEARAAARAAVAQLHVAVVVVELCFNFANQHMLE